MMHMEYICISLPFKSDSFSCLPFNWKLLFYRIWKTMHSQDKLSQPYHELVFSGVLLTIFQVIEVFKTKMGISISLAALMT